MKKKKQQQQDERKMMSSTVSKILLSFFLLLMLLTQRSEGASTGKQWCVADSQTPDEELQEALDWACGRGGADCGMIQRKKPCYLPNTVRDHASYAFNSYWQKSKSKGGTCYFKTAAMVTDLDPSHGSCQFESLP